MKRKYDISDSKEAVTLRKRKMKDGGYSLYLDYTSGGIRRREFLKLYLVPERNKIAAAQNQETLKTAAALKSRRIVEMQNGKCGFRRRNGEKLLLLDYMQERSDYYDQRGSDDYAQTVRNCAHYCEAFRGREVRLSQVDPDYLIKFIAFLNESELGDGTIYTYFNSLLIVLNAAVREDLIDENPSRRVDAKLKPKMKESTREFLTLDEVRLLMDTPCEDTQLKAAFLFACFTGLRISDVRALVWKRIVDVGEGRLQIQVRQTKTGGMVFVPLSANALRWMPERADGLVFPDLPAPATMDRRIEKWVIASGIKKHVTFHVARHTNATLMLTYGADLYTVSQLLGHKSITTTQIYGKIVNEKKEKAVNLIPKL